MVSCLYVADFPAWVRGRLVPERTDIAIHDRGRIVAATASLRAAGLRIGDALERAKSLFHSAQFFPYDPRRDAAVWEDVLLTVADTTPRMVSLQPGWALAEPYDAAGFAMLTRMLGAQAGTASRRVWAMLAALDAAPGTVRRVDEESADEFLRTIPVGYLDGLGYNDELLERLCLFGLRTIANVRMLTRRHLVAQFGAIGASLFDLLHPKGAEAVVPLFQPPPSVAASYDFDEPALEPAEILPVLDDLVEEVARRLDGRTASLLTLRLRDRSPEGLRLERRVLKSPASRLAHLRVIARLMLEGMLTADRPLTSIAVELGGLAVPHAVQQNLFDERPAIYETVRTLHRRFPGRVVRAVVDDPHARLPERGIRYEPYPAEPYPVEPPPKKRRRPR